MSQLTPDFSLVLGGPLYRFWFEMRLTDDSLHFQRRRVLVMVLLAWLPLLLLSIAEGNAWGNRVKLPFLHDVELHVRLLIALPLMILAELFAHRRMRLLVGQFLDRGLIPDAGRPQFDAAVASAIRLRNSVAAEVLLLALVYVVGLGFIWRTHVALDVTSWYGVPAERRLQPSLAGWWLGFVSLPLFQFLLLRWYFRLIIWARFLWHVSKIDLQFVPTHPDRAGGLGFLGVVPHALSPVLLAQGAMLSGMIADRIIYAGAPLLDFKVELIWVVVLLVFAILGPMLVFGPKLAAAKRAGLREYGTLAQRYVREFDGKWLRGGAPADEPLVGTADIQSLADLSASYAVVSGMRWVPFTGLTVLQLAATTLVPVVPLTLTMISMDEILERLLSIIF